MEAEPVAPARRELPTGTCVRCGGTEYAWVLAEERTPGLCRLCAAIDLSQRRRVRNARIAAALVACLLVSGVGGVLLFRRYVYVRSAAYSLRRLQMAAILRTSGRQKRYVDFEGIGKDLQAASGRVRSTQQVSPSILIWFLFVLPNTFSLPPDSVLERGEEAFATYSSTIVLPDVPCPSITFRLERRRDADGEFWRIVGVENADEVISRFVEPRTSSSYTPPRFTMPSWESSDPKYDYRYLRKVPSPPPGGSPRAVPYPAP